jgi:lincosamide nucleotidyltransferase A/C/D/E
VTGTAPGGAGSNGSEAAPGKVGNSRSAVLTEKLRAFIKRYRILMGPAEWLGRTIDTLPGPMKGVAARLHGTMLRETRLDDLLVVVGCLESEGVGYWLAGGWGVDALTGRQTRRHKDIDCVIDDFEHNEPKVRGALLALGFRHMGMDEGGVWMPRRSNFEDAAGHRVELLNIDWDHLRDVFSLDPQRDPAASWTSEILAGEMLAVGSIDDRRLPCLTAAAQLLFHSGFYLEPSGHANIALLQSDPDVAPGRGTEPTGALG